MKAQDIEYLKINYNFSSETGDIDLERYVNQYSLEIYGWNQDDEGNINSELIGKGSVYCFLMGLAINEHVNMRDLFDFDQPSCDLGELIIDWKKKDISRYFKDIILESCSSNILYINRIEILPEFKGNGFGKYIMKDIIYRFDNCCGLVALKAFPLQFEIPEENDVWYKRMRYEEYIQEEKSAKKQLFNFYKSVGFTQYKKSEYFYLAPDLRNEKLRKINLNTSFNFKNKD